MSRASTETKPIRRSSAAERKAAMQSRSGIERNKPEKSNGSFPIGKGRKALKVISIYMHPLAKDILDRIARDQDRTVQDLGLEALNLLFVQYGQKPIA